MTSPDEQHPDSNRDPQQGDQRGDQPPPPSGDRSALGHGFSSPGPAPDQPSPAAPQQEQPWGQQEQSWGHQGPSAYGEQPYAQQPHPGSGYPAEQGQHWGYPAAPPTHSRATTAMVLGLVALVGSLFSCGLTLVAGPFAWWQGHRAVGEIDQSQGRLGGRDQARGGQIMGIVATVLLVLLLIAVVVFVALLIIGLAAESGYDGRVY